LLGLLTLLSIASYCLALLCVTGGGLTLLSIASCGLALLSLLT
jgi:hypothetical protein